MSKNVRGRRRVIAGLGTTAAAVALGTSLPPLKRPRGRSSQLATPRTTGSPPVRANTASFSTPCRLPVSQTQSDFANNLFIGSKSGYSVDETDMAIVVCLRHRATPMRIPTRSGPSTAVSSIGRDEHGGSGPTRDDQPLQLRRASTTDRASPSAACTSWCAGPPAAGSRNARGRSERERRRDIQGARGEPDPERATLSPLAWSVSSTHRNTATAICTSANPRFPRYGRLRPVKPRECLARGQPAGTRARAGGARHASRFGRVRHRRLDRTAAPDFAATWPGSAGAVSATPTRRASCSAGWATRSSHSCITPSRILTGRPVTSARLGRWLFGLWNFAVMARAGSWCWPASASRSSGPSSHSSVDAFVVLGLVLARVQFLPAVLRPRPRVISTSRAGTSSAGWSSRCSPIRWATSSPSSSPAPAGAAFSGLWIHDAVGLFVTPMALAIIYFVIPAASGGRSTATSCRCSGFWLLFFLYPLNGTHHYVFSVIPMEAQIERDRRLGDPRRRRGHRRHEPVAVAARRRRSSRAIRACGSSPCRRSSTSSSACRGRRRRRWP